MSTPEACEDRGACHHSCPMVTDSEGDHGFPCFRVLAAGPLSGVFPDDEWPRTLVQSHRFAQERVDREAAERIKVRAQALEGVLTGRVPESLDLTGAARYLAVVRADLGSAEHHAARTDPGPATSAYFAALDMWEALTGLTGDAALEYAETCRQRPTTAAVPPF